MSVDLARKRAQKFFQYHNLSLPVNVENLLSSYAIVEETFIPIDGDAICINKNEKPHIIIKNNMSTYRKRFTYAHELAHIQIPSHTGMISCTTDFSETIDMNAYYQIEQEANTFAAELLMPSQWIKSLFPNYMNISDIVDTICQNANVSFMAALYNVIPVAPNNLMFFIFNKISDYSHIKQGSNNNRPLLLTLEHGYYDYDWLDLNCLNIEDIKNKTMDIEIFKFKTILGTDSIIKISKYFSSKENCKNICDKIVSSTSISFAHLFRELKEYLSAGFVIKLKCISSGAYAYIYASETYIDPRIYDESELYEWLSSNSEFYLQSRGSSISIDVWYFNTTFYYNENLSDRRDSKTILRSIIDYYYTEKSERASIFGRINGIIGSLNSSKTAYSEEQFYNILKQKFFSRTDLELITSHEDFNQYLVKKTKEILKNRIKLE